MLATLRQRNFALLWFGGLISETGDWLLTIGLPIYVYLLTHSALQTSTLFMAESLPTILLGSVTGVFVDRWNRRRTLVLGSALQGVILVALLTVRTPAEVWIIYVVALAESVIVQFMSPALNALLPTLVDEDHIVSANSLVAVNANLARLVGAPLGGFVIGFWGLHGVVLLDSASFFLAAIMIAAVSVPAITSQPTEDAPLGLWVAVWHDWLAGIEHLHRHGPARPRPTRTTLVPRRGAPVSAFPGCLVIHSETGRTQGVFHSHGRRGDTHGQAGSDAAHKASMVHRFAARCDHSCGSSPAALFGSLWSGIRGHEELQIRHQDSSRS